MLYFVIALHNNARPVIDYFGLKRDVAPGPFPIFAAEGCALCLSGEGRANAAAASAYLLTRWHSNGMFVHIGPGGDGGKIAYPHTISDGKETAYQEMLYKTPPFIVGGSIEDAEGLCAFKAASFFLPLQQVMVVRACGAIDERTLSWLAAICSGMISFPTYTWKKGRADFL